MTENMLFQHNKVLKAGIFKKKFISVFYIKKSNTNVDGYIFMVILRADPGFLDI